MMPKVSTKKIITTMSEVKEISKFFQTLKLFFDVGGFQKNETIWIFKSGDNPIKIQLGLKIPNKFLIH